MVDILGDRTLLPLQLNAKAGNWSLFINRKTDPAFQPFTQKVFERDGFACQYCGFQAKDYQEIINTDQNYRNNKMSNLVTACCFCAQCCFLESVGVGDYGGGTLILLPEISQGELNSLCHVLFNAITNDTDYKASAQSIYRSFKFRSQMVEQKFGEGSSRPSVFGQLIIDTEGFGKTVSKEVVAPIRLLPSRAKFREQIEHWAVDALDELSAEF